MMGPGSERPEPDDAENQPTNVPDDLEERAHGTFKYTTRRSASGYTAYVKPQTEQGYPDYTLMLDLMGLEPGVMFEIYGVRYLVTGRHGQTVQWGEKYEEDDGALKTLKFEDGRQETRWFTSDGEGRDSLSVAKSLWERYIHGDLTVLGNVEEVEF